MLVQQFNQVPSFRTITFTPGIEEGHPDALFPAVTKFVYEEIRLFHQGRRAEFGLETRRSGVPSAVIVCGEGLGEHSSNRVLRVLSLWLGKGIWTLLNASGTFGCC